MTTPTIACKNLGYDFSGRIPKDQRFQSLWAQTTALGCQEALPPTPPPSGWSLSVYVDIDGDDAAGDGTPEKPYRTVAFAMTTIATATRFRRFVVFVGPGRFDETQTIFLKANVLVSGSGNQFATRIAARIRLDPNDVAPSSTDPFGWNGSDPRSGFENLVLAGPPFPEPDPILIDWTSATFGSNPSNEGKIYFVLCNINVPPTLVSYSNINQALFQSCLEFPGHRQTGVNVAYIGSTVIGGGSVILTSSSTTNTTFGAFGGASNGPIAATWTDTHGRVELDLYSFPNDSLTTTVVGPGVNQGLFLNATSDSIPRTKSIHPRTTLTLLNDAESVAYVPSDPLKWPSLPGHPTPTTVQDALDYLAFALLP